MEKKNKVILVLEDERPLLEAVKIKLEKNGYDVLTARSVQEGKRYFEDSLRIDAIWLDHYLLGKEDGLSFVMWCKQEENKKCNIIPIFVVSNTASMEKVTTYLKFGVKEFFIKSNHRLEEIVDAIDESILENKTKE